jgi:L-threonylcarbamoyladenylate synthase
VAVYLDGGPTTVSVPSSIVDVTGPVPVLVRPGWITLERLREIVPDLQEASAV